MIDYHNHSNMKNIFRLPISIDLNHIPMTLAQVILDLVTAGEASGRIFTARDRTEEPAARAVDRRGVAVAVGLASECPTARSACCRQQSIC